MTLPAGSETHTERGGVYRAVVGGGGGGGGGILTISVSTKLATSPTASTPLLLYLVPRCRQNIITLNHHNYSYHVHTLLVYTGPL